MFINPKDLKSKILFFLPLLSRKLLIIILILNVNVNANVDYDQNMNLNKNVNINLNKNVNSNLNQNLNPKSKEIFPNTFKPSIPIGKAYNVNGHRNPDLLSFKTPVESKLINQEMKIRGLEKGIKVLSKNIATHRKKAAKSETNSELMKHNEMIAKNINNIAQMKTLKTAAKTKMKTIISSIPPQMKPVIVKKLKLEHRM